MDRFCVDSVFTCSVVCGCLSVLALLLNWPHMCSFVSPLFHSSLYPAFCQGDPVVIVCVCVCIVTLLTCVCVGVCRIVALLVHVWVCGCVCIVVLLAWEPP